MPKIRGFGGDEPAVHGLHEHAGSLPCAPCAAERGADMKADVKPRMLGAVAASLLLAACASTPDHFYTLSTLPNAAPPPGASPSASTSTSVAATATASTATAAASAAAPIIQMRLNVTVPPMVDRSEMVLNTSSTGVLILEHERWAAGLADEVAQTLARDIEQRRSDLLIGDRRFDQAASPAVAAKVDIILMSAERGVRARLEAHWRIVDAAAGTDQLGSDAFTAPIEGSGYAAVARAYSDLLSQLAGKLADGVRRR
jgi:uncharacterized lipoprotein YmbA